jgi:hypothetical protein
VTPEELERRKPVWDAMSDVFLDTETRWSMPYIAHVLVQSGYGPEELDAIWWREIVPECAWNLLQVAGEWALLVVDEDKLAARADGDHPILERMMGVAAPLFLGRQWRAILALRQGLLDLPAAERHARTTMWTAFIHLYLEPSRGLEKVSFLDEYVASLRATATSEHAMLAAFELVRPTFRSLLVGSEHDDEERRAREVCTIITRATHDEPSP